MRAVIEFEQENLPNVVVEFTKPMEVPELERWLKSYRSSPLSRSTSSPCSCDAGTAPKRYRASRNDWIDIALLTTVVICVFLFVALVMASGR